MVVLQVLIVATVLVSIGSHDCLVVVLQGGSVFSPSLLQTPPSSRRLALQLATELGCSDVTDDAKMVACLRVTPAYILNAAQTRVTFFNNTVTMMSS